jgi:transcriptional regulator with XRE-family HTH domain
MDRDLLAEYLQQQIDERDLTIREAAAKVGCSPATLTRLLKGKEADNYPDTTTLIKATSWLGRSLSDFEPGRRPQESSMAEVEVHLRALPGLTDKDRNALIAMVKAAHDAGRKVRDDQT